MAISKHLSFLHSISPGQVVIGGSFAGSGSLGVKDVELKGGSVTRNHTGSYDITLPGQGSLRLQTVQVSTFTSGSWTAAQVADYSEMSRSLRVEFYRGNSPVRSDALESEKIYFLVLANNSKAL